jgi:membrane protease YdiL (CAAX protease family)
MIATPATRRVVLTGLLLQAVLAAAVLRTNSGVEATMAASLPVAMGSAVAGSALYVAVAGRAPKWPALANTAALGKIVLMGTALAVVAVSEEILWRGWAFQILIVHGTAAALILTSLGFAAMHSIGQSFAGVRTHLATGAVFGLLRLITGSIGASIVAHIVYNEIVLAQNARADAKGRVTS